ncbi:TolC family protein [Nitrospira sp. T9]|uniref:TolC family protein n=1 Tax=unclassified Nitrospira TaxID=2652172 RepID=UPI003F994ED4
MMGHRLLTLLCAVALLGACLSGVSHAQDTKQVLHAYTLEEIIQLTLRHNPLVKKGEAFIEKKQSQQVIAGAYPNPRLNVQSGYSEFRDSADSITTIERYVTLSQPLEWRPKREARKQAALEGLGGAKKAFEETQIHLKAAARLAFYDLFLAEKRAELAIQNLKVVKELQQGVRSRVKAGDAPPFEEVKINVELLKVQKEITGAQGAVHAAKAALDSLTAGTLGLQFSIHGRFKAWPENLDLQVLTTQALNQHPTREKFQKLLKQAQHSLIEEKEAVVPNVTLSGSYQRDAGREAFLGGLTVPLPLWYQRDGEIADALSTQHEIEADLLKWKQDTMKDVAGSFYQSQAAAAQIHNYKNGLLKQAKEAVRIAQVSFQYGQASLLEVLDAQRIFWQTILGYAQAQYDLSIALTQLERSIGGEI